MTGIGTLLMGVEPILPGLPYRAVLGAREAEKRANEMVAEVKPETVKKLPTGEFGILGLLSCCPDQPLILKVIHVWRSGSAG